MLSYVAVFPSRLSLDFFARKRNFSNTNLNVDFGTIYENYLCTPKNSKDKFQNIILSMYVVCTFIYKIYNL
jgi:hypothetical protein